MARFLCLLGHVATTAEILERYGDGPMLRYMSSHRDILHPRRGVHACAHLAEPVLRAVELGGRLDCVTVLHQRGLLPADQADGCLHVRLVPGSGRAAAARHARPSGTTGADPAGAATAAWVAHWSVPRFTTEPGVRRPAEAFKLWVPLPEALRQSMRCLDGDQVLLAIRTAIETGQLDARQAAELVEAAPRRLTRMLSPLKLTSPAQKLRSPYW